MFPTDLPIVLPDGYIDFAIDFELRIMSIFIPLYRLALGELKELNEQL